MRNIFQPIVDLAASRTQQEWRGVLQAQVERLRGFIRDNGEVAAVLGFVIGIAMVLFFKLFLVLFCLIALGYLALVIFAKE